VLLCRTDKKKPGRVITPEQFKKIFMDHVEGVLAKTKEHVAMIEKRGGRVIFLRFPSSGRVRELENQFFPRPVFYDRLVAASGNHIHFEDHSELQGFLLPEWSHLTRADATEYTRRLMPLIKPLMQ